MKTILFLLFTAVTLFAEDAWPKAKYSEVRAYCYNANGETEDPVMAHGKLHPSVTNPKGALLTKQQVGRLVVALNGEHLDYPRMACYEPRHGFVFYDEARHPVAVFSLCFSCQQARAEPSTPAMEKRFYDLPELAKLCEELALPLTPNGGTAEWYKRRFDAWREHMNERKKAKAK